MPLALFGCDGSAPLSHTNDSIKGREEPFSLWKWSPNRTELSEPNRALESHKRQRAIVRTNVFDLVMGRCLVMGHFLDSVSHE